MLAELERKVLDYDILYIILMISSRIFEKVNNQLFVNFKKTLGSLKSFKDKFEKKESEVNEFINENQKLKF